MTDQLRQAAQQALEALENTSPLGFNMESDKKFYAAITALQAALEQPEQEPTPWRDMIVVSLVREGINKHRARELADHFSTTPTAQWDKPSVSFNEWWDSNVMPPANPFAEGSAAYWAWAGWKAAQRPWVGLTEEDWDHIDNTNGTSQDTFIQGAAWAAARLKERNNG
jgi:hypothetical protein